MATFVGHINRLKMLKRQMYGRAKIDLLERRFLERNLKIEKAAMLPFSGIIFVLQTSLDFKLNYELQKSIYLAKGSTKMPLIAISLRAYSRASELYGLTNQIRRSAVSVASNIAEGYGRRSKQEYVQFLHIANGSLRELDTQLIIAKEVDLAEKNLFTPLLNEVEEMQSILVASLNKLKV